MNKTILITGASSGIGEALALEWSHQKNVTLILAARNREALEKVRGECVANGAEVAVVVELDLSNGASIEKAVTEIYSKYPQIDVVVHNGGISQRSFIKETTMDVYRRLMEVNFFGTVHLTKLLLPKMLAAKSGQFVVVTSVMGKIGTPFRSGYAASKHALHGFFDSLRAEVSRDGISVTMVCPGFVKTPLTLSALSADGSKYNKLDPFNNSGMDPAEFAKKMIAAVEAKKEEVYIGGAREVMGVYLKRFAPKLLSKAVANMKVK
jgi:dehydrogenase/reductase SDR family protein 7B